jgi:hypothetical protein
MKVPEDHAVDAKHMDEFLGRFWGLDIMEYPDQGDFPEIVEKDFIRFRFKDSPEWILWIGGLDPKKGAYPVYFQSQNLKAWVVKEDLEVWLDLPPEALYSKRFLEIPIERLERVRFVVGDEKIFFVFKDHIWYHVKDRQVRESFEPMEIVLNRLNDLEYFQKLGRNEKSALLFDPNEVGLKIFLFREGERRPFMYLKCYLREDYYYLEINDSPPLYVISPVSFDPVFQILAQLQKR